MRCRRNDIKSHSAFKHGKPSSGIFSGSDPVDDAIESERIDELSRFIGQIF